MRQLSVLVSNMMGTNTDSWTLIMMDTNTLMDNNIDSPSHWTNAQREVIKLISHLKISINARAEGEDINSNLRVAISLLTSYTCIVCAIYTLIIDGRRLLGEI